MPACPNHPAAQTFPLSTASSLLCVYRDVAGGVGNWNHAEARCRTAYGGAYLCRYEQIRRACIAGMVMTQNVWMGDRIGDDEGIRTNSTDCNNFDESEDFTSNFGSRYCCLEWMKY
jgi:hypothetical protein